MQTPRRVRAVLTLAAIAYVGVACERETPFGVSPQRGVAPAASLTPGDASTPVNFIDVSFAPIYSTTSYNYDWSTGTLTEGTATGSVFSTANTFEALVSDPTPPDPPNGFGTFIGTAHPERFDGQTVAFTQSVCPSWPLFDCLFDGTFTFGYMVMYNTRGKTLDQITNLATQYYLQHGDCGGGAPRFSIVFSNGAEVHVYLGDFPSWTCTSAIGTWQSTGNLVTDPEPRWDSTQLCIPNPPSPPICGAFYGTYSQAVTQANALGLTIAEIFLGTDGSWSADGGAPSGNQTALFKSIQVNGVTRFPQ